MIIEIGIVAGEIWQLLDKHGTLRIGEINSKLKIVVDWKEGDAYKDYKVTLRK
jgi:hypothetical protein